MTRKSMLMFTLLLSFILFNSSIYADEWNGYGRQFKYRISGGNTVGVWYGNSTRGNDYYHAMNSALIGWYKPKVDGKYEDDGAAVCSGAQNNFWYKEVSDYQDAQLEVYAEKLGFRFNGIAYPKKFGSENRLKVYDPDKTPYDYSIVKFNKNFMDRRDLYNGVQSKRAVAAHEMGHVLGLSHYETSGTVMASEKNRTVIGPTCNDHNSLKVRW